MYKMQLRFMQYYEIRNINNSSIYLRVRNRFSQLNADYRLDLLSLKSSIKIFMLYRCKRLYGRAETVLGRCFGMWSGS